jgi:6-phosphogluconolactonase
MKNDAYTRREFVKVAGLMTVGVSVAGSSAVLNAAVKPEEMLVYVGTYTGKSEGIYLYKLSLSSGELTRVGVVKGVRNPSYVALDRRRKYLYAVNEVDDFGGKKSGAVSAFSIDQKTGGLKFLNQQASLGAAPCYLFVDDASRFVFTANYSSGNVTVFPVGHDGALGEPVETKQYSGSGPNPERQEGPHAHCILLDQPNRHAYSCDLGTDKIMIFDFDAKIGKLTPAHQPWLQVKPGAGPRHLTFHPNGRYAYVIDELDSTVSALAHDAKKGTLKEMQTVPALPVSFTGSNTTADIHVSPDGRFLYGSNRGHDSIVSFQIDPSTGKLNFIEHTSTQGKTPRNFAIDPSGRLLLVANQNSDSIVTFHIDPSSGKLTPTGHVADVPTPVCLKVTKPFG